jgi:hypothetical protein
VLFEAATGEPAFGEPDDASWEDDSVPSSETWDTDDQLDAGYPQLDAREPACRCEPAELAAAIEACLAPDPDDRPTLRELAAMLVPLAPGARPWDG